MSAAVGDIDKAISCMLGIVLLMLIALTLVIPKLVLATYTHASLWGHFRLFDIPFLIQQDLALAAGVFCVLLVALRKRGVLPLIACASVTTLILSLLLIDCRVRELWLKPVGWDLVRYCCSGAGDLVSGSELFFKMNAGLGLTFRRLAVYVLGLHVGLWLAVFWWFLWANRRGKSPSTSNRRVTSSAAGVAVVLLVTSLWTPTYIYGTETNILAAAILSPIRASKTESLQIRRAAESCDQKLHPLAATTQPDSSAAAYRNLVVIILESVRWKGLGLQDPASTFAPHLKRLASEGILAKCYVSIPHSSKSQFAILTGRHPYPGIEIREAMRERFPSILWSLRERGVKTFGFSVQNLAFENTGGLLRACGIQQCLGPLDLLRSAAAGSQPASSFGESDLLLLDKPIALLAQRRSAFAAVFITLAAHYPYDYPGKTGTDGAGIESYWKSVAYADENIGRLLDRFRECDLLEGTLFVLVGDHGEEFGEHGTFVHNNSMYEEGTTVPLVFWASSPPLASRFVRLARQIDIAPTIADLMGVRDPAYQVQGRSMLSSDIDETVYLMSFFNRVSAAIIEDSRKIMWFPPDDRILAYDLGEDPDESKPLTLPEAVRASAKRRLQAFRAYQQTLYDY